MVLELLEIALESLVQRIQRPSLIMSVLVFWPNLPRCPRNAFKSSEHRAPEQGFTSPSPPLIARSPPAPKLGATSLAERNGPEDDVHFFRGGSLALIDYHSSPTRGTACTRKPARDTGHTSGAVAVSAERDPETGTDGTQRRIATLPPASPRHCFCRGRLQKVWEP
ncbi:hypothetical protein CKAH01_10324 [Colletotrichum kahawae]|uniref:Uncharacterized protein n=1 Tax=Colletotrichum kahawae TaxID=34407 RepID=A0AAD9XXD3_COLKA|nr:hypothetical protein CKAH01_10324 [Colletotrichum kahawae]